jgi:hypothetical protein
MNDLFRLLNISITTIFLSQSLSTEQIPLKRSSVAFLLLNKLRFHRLFDRSKYSTEYIDAKKSHEFVIDRYDA